MNKTLIVIDMQNDFAGPEPNALLATDETRKVVPVVKDVVEYFHNRGQSIIFTADTHVPQFYKDMEEGKRIPTHCVMHEWGWQIIDELAELAKSHPLIPKATFGSFNIDVVQPSDGIVIVGVCTDICVISNALILRAQYPHLPITIYADATAGTTPDNHRAALAVAAANCIDVKNWEDEK